MPVGQNLSGHPVDRWTMLLGMKPKIAARPYRHSTTYKFVLDLRAFGKGRKFFKTRTEAEAEALRQRTLLERHSRTAVGLSQRELSELIHARDRLAGYGKTVKEAADFLVDHLDRVLRHGITVAQLAAEVLEAKRRDGKAPAYLADLRKRLTRFCHDFGDRSIAGIGVEELDNWLRDLPLSPKSRANYRANIGVLFSYAESRGIIDKNPILRTAKPKLVDRPPEIFTADELRALLEAARQHQPDVLPMLAIGAFAGLREAEIKRLDWSEVDLVRCHIEVTAAKAKSARRRIVAIQPNLAAWLRPYSEMKGAVVPAGARKKLARIRKAAELVKWPNNGLRHSFASYRLAAIHDAPRVSAELGHASPQMLYSTYRELVLPEEAERYWKLFPPTETSNVISMTP
jgi:integrase